MSITATGPTALVDATCDRRLWRDGFVSFPLLSPEAVSDLRDRFGKVHGWDGQGFHADLAVPDPDYRRTVNDVLGEVLASTVTERFVDHEPFLYNFICKFPGADSELYLHRDWMYVDERLGHRTYVAWIALEDIHGDNGRLRVLRGSHRLDRALRGTELGPPWLEHQDVIRKRLRSVRVRAGDCVVFDNALLHCSYPNLTDEPRLVAAVGLRPRAAPLVHFRRADATTALRYDVDEDFFCDLTPQALLERPPPLPAAEVVPDNQLVLSATELTALLDGDAAVVRDRVVRRLAGLPGEAAGWAAVARTLPGRSRSRAARLARGLRRRAGIVRRSRPVRDATVRLAGSPATKETRSVLVIATAPDDRPSTKCLHDLVEELRRRDLQVAMWFVRAPDAAQWPGAHVVHAFEDWGPSRFLERVGAHHLAIRVRGLRRHVWLLADRPDVVIFDDAVGGSLVRRLRHPHVRVVRANARPPFDVPLDVATPLDRVDLTLVGPGASAVPGSRPFDAPLLRDWRTVFPDDPVAVRARARAALGVDDDTIVVVGSGRDGWLDGPEVFLRGLWTIEHRHGLQPFGVWFAPHADAHEIDRLRGEATRCGLGERVRFITDEDPDILLGGDAALLPYRAAGDAFDTLGLIGAGMVVVTFPVWDFEHSSLVTVPHLDLEAAADAVVHALEGDMAERRAHAPDELETVAAWVDRLIPAIDGCRR